MRPVRRRSILTAVFLLTVLCRFSHADLNNNYIINYQLADKLEELRKDGDASSKDFNACQITWSVRKLEKDGENAQYQPHEVTLKYEKREIVTLTNKQDGSAESIKELGINCLEFNDYVYVFFDTLNYLTRSKFGLNDLSYVTYSANKGKTWSDLISLESFSNKGKFVIPFDQFPKFVKILGNRHNHALSIFNLRDETTYLFDPAFRILKTVSVYNRLTNFNSPTDFVYFKNALYLVRGSCENIRGHVRCPSKTYMEVSRDFGLTWEKEALPFMKKSFLLPVGNFLYHFYYEPCASSWFNIVPGLDRSLICGNIKVRKLNILGQWEEPRVLVNTAEQLIDIHRTEKPILVWSDYRFYKARACGFIPVIGCVDSKPFVGPKALIAGEIDTDTWNIDESIIEFNN